MFSVSILMRKTIWRMTDITVRIDQEDDIDESIFYNSLIANIYFLPFLLASFVYIWQKVVIIYGFR